MNMIHLIAIAVSLQAATSLGPTLPWGATDFVQYYVAIELINEKANPYDHGLAGARQMRYGRVKPVEMYAPPWGLLPALPMGGFTLQQANLAYIAINIALLLLCTAAWNRLLFPEQPDYLLIQLLALFLWLPCLAVVAIGQNSLWPLAGLTGWLWCLAQHRPGLAGAALALTLVKPHLGLLGGLFALGYTLRLRKWKTISGFLIAAGAMTCLTIWLRPTIWQEYLQAIQTGTPPTQIATSTLDGFARWHLGQWWSGISWVIWIVSLAASGCLGWFAPRWDHNSPHQGEGWSRRSVMCFAFVVMLTPALVPYAFSMDFVMMLPGLVLVVGSWLGRRAGWRIALGVWLCLQFMMVAGRLLQWDEHNYWFIPWVGTLSIFILHPLFKSIVPVQQIST